MVTILRVRALLLLVAPLALAGCDTFLGASEDDPLPGDRIAVLQTASAITADAVIADLPVELPPAFENPDWPQAGGPATHAVGHPALGGGLSRAWSADLGAGSNDERQILASPVVAGGRVFAMDAESVVSAFDLASGRRLWRADLETNGESGGFFGGGVAYDDGRIYVTTGFAEVVALDAASGEEIWRHSIRGPMRAPPTVSGGRVFAITIDNQLVALDAGEGRELWTHSGLSELAGLVGGASPAVAGNVVVAPYSSGELYAIRVENGRVVWSDSLGTVERSNAIATLADIRGRPVVDRDLVVAVSHAGRTLGIDLRRGGRAWDLDVGGTADPWIAGDFVFLVSNEAQVVAITRNEGRIRWISQLPGFRDEENRKGEIDWAGPVLAGGRLLLAGSNGELVALAPDTGAIVGTTDLPGPTRLSPVVASATLLVVTDSGQLVAYR